MRTSDFNYNLPDSLIAQKPLSNRSDSKLLVLNRETGSIEHDRFFNLKNHLRSGDTLVLNDTRVIPARLLGVKLETGANIEMLLLKQHENDTWETLCKPARRIEIDTVVAFGNGLLLSRCVRVLDEGLRVMKMIYRGVFFDILDQLGEMPLPPYIHEKVTDRDEYQTVYAKNLGSAAAPTAGFHFTPSLLDEIRGQGVIIQYLTLHVGLGTFRPVQAEDISEHTMHSESYLMPEAVARELNEAKSQNRRIIAVGTTSTRVLEANIKKFGCFHQDVGETDIFIYPGYRFKAIDGLITNFHLPKSTLLMLVSAFATRDIIMETYREAIKQEYRFYSFGDAMFIK